MHSNYAINRLSVIDPSGTQILATVQTDHEVAGSKGGLHVFDDKGHEADFSFDQPKLAANGDDVYSGKISLSDSRLANFNLKKLQATAFCDVKQNDGSMYRLWGGSDTAIKKQPDDRTEPITIKAGPQNTSTTSPSMTLASGVITLGFNVLGTYDDTMGQTEYSLSKVSLKGNGFFGNAATLQAVIIPNNTNMVERGFTSGNDTKTIKTYEDDNESAKITLVRQSDGTYTAQAPNGRGFLDEVGFDDFDAGDASLRLSSVQIAIVDPKTGKWDSVNSNNYWLQIQ